MADVLYRATPELHLRGDGDGRTVYGVVVPYGIVAEVDDGRGPYREQFEPGAFSRSIGERSAKIRLFINHDSRTRLPIGRATDLQERHDGLHGAFVVSRTAAGDEALTLVRDGVVDAFSVGFRPIRERSDAGIVKRTEAALREVSLVGMPAYAGALVGGIRSAVPHLSPEDAARRLEIWKKAYR